MSEDAGAHTSFTPLSDRIATPLGPRFASFPGGWDLTTPEWVNAVVEQLRAISKFRNDWDGYGAGPIRRDVIEFAGHIIVEIMRLNTPPPQITPLSHEGLMLEWHGYDIDLEVEIERPGSLWVSFEDAVTGVVEEEPLASNLSMLIRQVTTLSERAAREQ